MSPFQKEVTLKSLGATNFKLVGEALPLSYGSASSFSVIRLWMIWQVDKVLSLPMHRTTILNEFTLVMFPPMQCCDCGPHRFFGKTDEKILKITNKSLDRLTMARDSSGSRRRFLSAALLAPRPLPETCSLSGKGDIGAM
jgi:hypothetical protein